MNNKMSYLWLIPVCLFIIGYFGIFWTLALSNIKIEFKMDNNTKEAITSIDYNAISNQYNINLSELNLENIGSFCKTKEPKGYALRTWWDGCSVRGGEIKFTCGFSNSDGANKYECYTITQLNDWLKNE